MSTSKNHPITPAEIDSLNQLLSSLQPPTSLVTPHTDADAYHKSLARWSAAAVKPAGAVLVPASLEQIQVAVRWADENAVDLAVKGGGHSTAGASSTDGGLLLDLGSSEAFARVQVDVESRTLKVGGGANWGMVDVAAFEHGLVAVGGTVADTGVGGLTLGGGYGWLSGLVGLVIDNLLEVTVVVADGEVIRASRSENQDFFWAVRGAGQNFGVCVEFVMQAYRYGGGEGAIAGADGGQAWAGLLLFDPQARPDMVEKVVEASNRLYETREFGQGGRTKNAGLVAGGVGLGRPPPGGGKLMIVIPVIYHGSEEKGKEAFKELLDLQPAVSTVSMVDYTALNHLLDVPPGFRVSMKGASFRLPIRVEFFKDIMARYESFTEQTQDAAHTLLLFELYDPAQVVGRASNLDCGFANRGWHLNGMIAPIWTKQENDTVCRQWARDLAALFKEELQTTGNEVGQGLEGGVGIKGDAGAVMLYGNYDRKFVSFQPCAPLVFPIYRDLIDQ